MMGKKWDDRRNGEKLLHLFTLLMYRNKSWPFKELAKELNCSKPTALRLIDQLNSSLYAYVWHEKVGRESHYSLKRIKNPPVLSLNPEGLRQLAVCKDFLLHLLPPESQKAMNVAMNQAKSLSDGGDDPLFLSVKPLMKGYIDYSPFQDVYRTMTEAIRKKKIVSLTYEASLKEEINRLDFAPLVFSLYHETLRFYGWVVNCKDQPVYENPTVLLLHRIRAADMTQRSSAKIEEPQILGNEYFGIIEGSPFQVTAHFCSAVSQYIYERRWSKDQKIALLDNGGLELTFTAQSEVEVFQWLLSFGCKVEVLAPRWLRDAIAKEADELVYKYSPKRGKFETPHKSETLNKSGTPEKI
jgi:predicted DNA-binding transcriptional regulator YafY